LTPGAAPPKRSARPFVLIAIAVVIVVAVGVFVVTRSGEGDGNGVQATAKKARTALQPTVDDADFNSDGDSDLSRCPLGRVKTLSKLVQEEVDLGEVADDDGSSQVKDSTDIEPQRVICSQVTSTFDDDSVPLAVAYEALLDPPKNIDAYLNDVADKADETFTAGDPVPFEGGTIHRGCQDNTFAPICTAVWTNSQGGIGIGVILVGTATDEDDASTALQQILVPALDNLAGK
jgi:hypothetical protein